MARIDKVIEEAGSASEAMDFFQAADKVSKEMGLTYTKDGNRARFEPGSFSWVFFMNNDPRMTSNYTGVRSHTMDDIAKRMKVLVRGSLF